MIKTLVKTVAVLLCLVLIAGMGTVAVFAQGADPDPDSTYYKGAYYYRPGAGEYFDLYDSVDYYTYSDDYFKSSAREFDQHLATVSMCLAEASVSSGREPFTPEGYANKSRDAVAFLEDIGFSDIEVNSDYTRKPDKDSMGAACAHKKIISGSKEYTLLVILPRSAGYEAEWGNNFVLGAEGDAEGFAGSAVKCLDFAKSYVEEHGVSGDIKVWCVGYSRGAATSNLIAKNLIDDPQRYLGEDIALTSDNLYCYNFGTPSAADIQNDPNNDRYAGIFNFYTNTELASVVAPAEMGFERYGTDIHLPDWERYDQMLDKLYICAPYIHEIYSTQMNSTLYHPKKLGLTAEGSLGLVDDENSYLPDNAAEYLAGEMSYLNEITGGRENYHAVYEKSFSDLIAYYEGLTGDDATAFTSVLLSNEKSYYLIAAMYAYFMKLKKQDISYEMNVSLLREKATEIVAIGSDIDEAETGIEAGLIAKVAAMLGIYLLMEPEDIKYIAAGYLGEVLDEAMTASGADDEWKSRFSDVGDREALVHIISHLLLGNIWQSDEVAPLCPENEQIKAAATLIGNAANLFTDHANEVIKSWLRLDDSYNADYSVLTSAQMTGYRRVYFENTDTLNAVITDSEGKTVAAVKNGVLDNSADKWIGFTATDEGGFFRFPLDESYTVTILALAETEISIRVEEYSVDAAESVIVFESAQTPDFDTTAVLSLPALDESYVIPSSLDYSLTLGEEPPSGCILGDADGDGEVTILDASAIQRVDMDLPVEKFDERAADVDGGGVDVSDVTFVQRHVAGMETPYEIGKLIYVIQ